MAALGFLACLPSYSYSDTSVQYGSTQNAAANAYNWVMTNVLPQQTGLQVNGVVYKYTAVKNPEDDMIVHVQNEDAQGPGYIFRSSDDWSGLPGNSINKSVRVAGIPIEFWGDGSIEVEGTGEVEDASVIYTYQFDPCFDPQSRPDCPGYRDPFVLELGAVEVVDPLDDDLIQDELDRKATLDDEDQEDRDRKATKSKKEIKESLEKLLGAGNTTEIAADAVAKHEALMALASIPQTYYSAIPGGEYVETRTLKDAELPDNKSGRRVGLAQQLLHGKMVDLQYETKEK